MLVSDKVESETLFLISKSLLQKDLIFFNSHVFSKKINVLGRKCRLESVKKLVTELILSTVIIQMMFVY